ncbi:MAG: thiol-disulfide oxidoreductase [Nitrospirales bacterium]|nr:MAG: thiol-disulfide oxidoreductase [Nitrospirales bacterium]
MSKQSSREHSPPIPAICPDEKTFLQVPPPYPLTVYFDGECPICRREIDLIKWLNRKKRLRFIDFSTSSYREQEHGLKTCDLGQVIHARWANGTTITGVEVFRRMWEAIGLGCLTRLSRFSPFDKLLIKAYAWFAKNRLKLTGRA